MNTQLDRTPLTKLEREAVGQFAATLTAESGARIHQLDLFGLDAEDFRENREIQLLVLTNREDSGLEDRSMDLVLDVLLETGIYLTVKTFSKSRYNAFRKAKIPMIERMEEDRIQLWKAA